MIPKEYLEITVAITSSLIVSAGTVMVLKYKSERMGKDLEDFMDEVRPQMNHVVMALKEQSIMHKMTVDTLASLNRKLEETHEEQKRNTTYIAILKDREEQKHGRT